MKIFLVKMLMIEYLRIDYLKQVFADDAKIFCETVFLKIFLKLE